MSPPSSSWIARGMRQRVQLERVVGLSSYGDRSYGPPQEVSARVEQNTSVIRDLDGEEVLITHRVALMVPVGMHDRITLDDGQVRYVKATQRAQTFQGGGSYTICEVG